MKQSFELSIEVSELYDFNKESINRIEKDVWVKNQWPIVYFIQNNLQKIAYVGESTNALSRIKNHLSNPERLILNQITIIGSDKFNKSATLEIETNLIQYITAEGTFKLQNGNYGLINHNYYQQDLYKNLFKEVWSKLIENKIVNKSLTEIESTELFKYSPYKSLNEDQYNSVLEILGCLTTKSSSRIFISGSAGTGKTVLATYIVKLLNSKINEHSLEEVNDDEVLEINYIREFQLNNPNAKIGLVIAMSSLRKSVENVFRQIPGLKGSMVISPSDTFNDQYDLLIIDEAHRLRQYRNIGWRGTFKKNNRKLGLDDTGTELDWIMANSRNQIFFYDEAQSVKPSDVDSAAFKKLLDNAKTIKLALKSQMRVKGGNNYIQFVDDIMQVKRKEVVKYHDENYELAIFDSYKELYSELAKREKQFGLCRAIAGYAWPWLTDPKKFKGKQIPVELMDIELDGLKFRWNSTPNDWINSPFAFEEIGCIHTTQGYDLNYAAVIFGKEINFNKEKNQIEIDRNKYFDIYGKTGIDDPEVLKSYIINIYKTLMYRGIRGTFIYACNKEMREYLKKHISPFKQEFPFRIIPLDDVSPYINIIPVLNLKFAAGNFTGFDVLGDYIWIEPPFNISAKKGYFI